MEIDEKLLNETIAVLEFCIEHHGGFQLEPLSKFRSVKSEDVLSRLKQPQK